MLGMMKQPKPLRTARLSVAIGLMFSCGALFSQELMMQPPDRPPLVEVRYEEVTSGERIELVAREWNVPGGLLLESTSSTGDRHLVLVAEGPAAEGPATAGPAAGELVTQSWRFEAGSGRSEVTANRENGSVAVTGVIEGERTVAQHELDAEPWLQSIERSLRRFVLGGDERDRLRFTVVQPDNLEPRVLQARLLGTEERTVAGVPTTVRRVRIGLPGIGAIIWSSDYWFRASDGLFVESHVTRGPPGTPETVVRLIEPAARQ